MPLPNAGQARLFHPSSYIGSVPTAVRAPAGEIGEDYNLSVYSNSYFSLHAVVYSPISVFLELLQQHPLIQKQPPGPSTRLVGVIAKDRGLYAELLSCTTPIQAFTLYKKALQVLSTNAKEEIEHYTECTLLVGNRIEFEVSTNTFIYRAFKYDLGMYREFYFKIKEGADLRQEEMVWKKIVSAYPEEAARYFVPTTLVPIHNLTNHPHVTQGLLSPIMLGTLFELPVAVTRHLVSVVYRAMQTALSMLHNLHLVHCVVKPQNIFRDSEGCYHLADYDGCLAVHEKINLSTRSFWPSDLQLCEKSSGGLKATPRVDYMMLAATLLFLADQWNFLPGMQPTLAEMHITARTMKASNAPCAEEVLECIELAYSST